LVKPQDLSLSCRKEKPDRFPDAFWTADNQQLADRSDVIVLSVRPADWRSVSADARGKLIISVMAGIRLDQLIDHHGTNRVIRSLPNAAAEVGKSFTPWIGSAAVTDQDRAVVRAIFDACGEQDEIGHEADIDYLTGLSGSGPAFPALLAAAMMNDAVARGLHPDIAQRAVNVVLTGTGRLIERRDECPSGIVDTFIGYRGTTAAAIESMRTAGFDRAVAQGLAAAFEKSIGMGDAS
jgi:pyrroline-5-carboxylate reductase